MATLVPEADFRALSRQPPPDPDIQATLSDFLTYTEHFPSHVTRALALIEDRRARSEQKIKIIHDKTTLYSILPSLSKDERPDPIELSRHISYALEEAEKASRMALEEAIRLGETCQRESKRLDFVVEKLKAQPMPPSRDPTPEAQLLTSPNLRRERGMASRVDESRSQRTSRHLDDQAATKLRGRKVMVPGEVLPPPDPNAPPESISDWSSPPPSPPAMEDSPSADRAASPRARARTPKFSRADRGRDRDRDRNRDRKGGAKPRTPRQPGQPGTNAHSAVAGISTSNALLALTAPPPEAVKGSRWLPWMKLTEWEMAKLRKRMKKNAIWVPSQTMVRRELKNLGRGLAGKEAAKAAAEGGGEPFVDESTEGDPTKLIIDGAEDAGGDSAPGPQIYAEDEDADAELVNRGMRLNEAKKLKRQRMMEEQALQAQLAREQGVDAGNDGKLPSGSADGPRKRKREVTPTGDTIAGGDVPSSPDLKASMAKKLKVTAPALPLPAASKTTPASASLSVRARRAATPQETKRPVLILNPGKAVSEEPPNRRSTLRRGSNVSLPNGSTLPQPTPTTDVTGRRRKRPAPGILTSSHDVDGGSKVGVSKRKAAPKKKTSLSKPLITGADGLGQVVGADQMEEYVDPDEPRYCVCGDVSWGTMIACDNDDCEKEWFHLSCVGLDELPPRRTKWYCPDCRKKLKLGQASNGIMGKAQGR